MKNRLNIILVFAITLLIGSTPINAVSQEEEEFSNFIVQTFETNFNEISNGGSTAPFLSAFSPKLTWMTVTVNINGSVSTAPRDKAALKNKMSLLELHPNANIKFKVLEVSKFKSQGNTLLASFMTSVEVMDGDKVIETGGNLIEVVAKKFNDSYTITYFSYLNVVLESYKGTCYANIKVSEVNENLYVTNTFYPNGSDYAMSSDSISFIGTDKLRVIKCHQSGQTYYWNTIKGNISLDKDGSRVIGVTMDKNEVISLILKDQNSEHCKVMVRSAKTQ